jgi:hypothetical protein
MNHAVLFFRGVKGARHPFQLLLRTHDAAAPFIDVSGAVALFPMNPQAQRAFEIARRLLEQSRRLGVPCSITLAMPTTATDLYLFEGRIQQVALNLSRRTGIKAVSLETLIDQLERYGTGATRVGPWQAEQGIRTR